MSQAFQSQLEVKAKCEQMQQSLKELYAWEEEMKEKARHQESTAKQCEFLTEGPVPPVRSDVEASDKFTEDQLQLERKKQAVTQHQKDEAEALKTKGNKLCKLGNYTQAIEMYAAAIELDGTRPEYYSNRALCHLKLEQYNECIADCDKAIVLDSCYVKAYYRRMQAYECLGDNVKAALECHYMLQMPSDDSEVARIKTDLERIMKRLPTAVAVAEDDDGNTPVADDTLQLVKQEADKFKELGNKHLQRKDYEKAEQCYTKAIALHSGEAIYYGNRSVCHWNLKDYDKCHDDCDKAIALDPDYFRPYYRRMQVRELRGEFKTALEDCRKFLSLVKEEKQRTTAEKDFRRLLEQHVAQDREARRKQQFTWSDTRENAKLIKFVQKPPHMRSRRPVRRIAVEEVGIAVEAPAEQPEETKYLAASQYERIPDAVIDRIFNNNTGERHVEPQEKSDMRNLFPASSSGLLKKMFSPPTTPQAASQPAPFDPVAHATVPKPPPVMTLPLIEADVKRKPTLVAESQAITTAGSNGSRVVVLPKPVREPLVTIPSQQTVLPPLPKSSVQFYSTWSGLSEDLRFQYLQLLENVQLSKLLGASLSSETLSQILSVLRDRYVSGGIDVSNVLQQVISSEGINILVMLLNQDDQKSIRTLVSYMREQQRVSEEIIATIERKLLTFDH